MWLGNVTENFLSCALEMTVLWPLKNSCSAKVNVSHSGQYGSLCRGMVWGPFPQATRHNSLWWAFYILSQLSVSSRLLLISTVIWLKSTYHRLSVVSLFPLILWGWQQSATLLCNQLHIDHWCQTCSLQADFALYKTLQFYDETNCCSNWLFLV